MTASTSINPKEVAKFHQLADHWWDKNGPFKTLHDINPVRLNFILAHLKPQGQRVLDLGCGGGLLTESLAAAGFKMTGLDADSASIFAAQAHARESSFDIDYVCSAVEIYDGTFDAVTCMEMLEHVDNPALILSHAARLLKPDGLLLVSTINRSLKSYLMTIVGAEYILSLLPRQTHDYSHFIRPGELADAARCAGFELCDLQGMIYHPLSGQAALTHDVSVNYLMALRRII